MKYGLSACVAFIFLIVPSALQAQSQLVGRAGPVSGYAAFPDICRLTNGDLYCVFYDGYAHVSTPTRIFPKGGQIVGVRSTDDGRTWSKPFLVVDTTGDDRDPSVVCLKDRTMLLNWFVPTKSKIYLLISRSRGGENWSRPTRIEPDSPYSFACSSPIRQLPDGSLILGLYHEDPKANVAFGATIKSYDEGKTWKDLALIGENSGIYLDAETDVLPLKDGKLLAALRSSKVDMYFAISTDKGKTWGEPHSFGFKGQCPYLLRHSSGIILLAHRDPATALHWSADDGKTWHGPVQIDTVPGAYPSMVELPDHSVYCVYYEEGRHSSIRGMRLKVNANGVTLDPYAAE